MGNINKLTGILILITGILLILSINTVIALGVNTPYWNGNPLKMYTGETKSVPFALANSVNEKTTETSVSITKGGEIAKITSGEKYTVKPGETGKNIILSIKIPQTAQIGDNYTVGFKVLYLPTEGEGNIKLNVEYNVDFPVEVVGIGNESAVIQPATNTGNASVGQTEKTSIMFIIIIISIAILILLVIISLVFMKLKKDNTVKQKI